MFWLSTFPFLDVLTSYLQKGPLWHTKSCLWIWSSFCSRHIRIDFFNNIFHNLALLKFYFLNIIYILLYIDFILSIFFQHSNILTRASHHWCLASNIVLVCSVSGGSFWDRPPGCTCLFWIQSGRGLDCSTSLPRGRLRPIAAEPQSAQGGTMEQSSWWAKICHFGEVGHWSRSLAAFFFRKFLGD